MPAASRRASSSACPTPFDKAKTPDLSYVRAATRRSPASLRPGMLVILQSTTYPGHDHRGRAARARGDGPARRCRLPPRLLARARRSGEHHMDRAEHAEGRRRAHARNATAGRAALLESRHDDARLVRQVVGSPAAAEMAKLLENTYRAVNIALVNELAMLCHEMDIDVWEVIDAAATKPFGFQAFRPGHRPGGHCIPVDPHYLSWKAREFDFQHRSSSRSPRTSTGDGRLRAAVGCTRSLNRQGLDAGRCARAVPRRVVQARRHRHPQLASDPGDGAARAHGRAHRFR